MNNAIPVIHESADQLKQLLAHERHPSRHQRLHALYLLASGQARFRNDVAELLGVSRNTLGRWLDRYAHGGLDALLALYRPAGKPPALAPHQEALLRARLQQPDGFAGYGAAQQWIADTFGVQLSYHATHALVHYKLGATLKVARPSHQKKR